ncbi:glutathione synthase [Rickenella mellea]|uniref:Glutathione synthetase n=1 Tax=Rickenella mellea TaxID=50990 RepID=A0A4Y7PNT0_9AGAM|nr:glutathione synthase [Rickenella mellea]
MSTLPEWPPNISQPELEYLTKLATTYALSHGLLYLPPHLPSGPPPPTQAPSSAIHAPLSIFPSPFPRELFERAQRLQSVYNVLYARIAQDAEFLDRVMGAEVGAGRVDVFTGELWKIWKNLRDDGIEQELQLGIFRSDYLLHVPDESSPMTLKQVEFNTISSSFGALSERVSALHNHLYASTGYFNSSPHLKRENFPPNRTTAGIVDGLVAAHEAYGVKDARILFVVQAGERNVFDQRWLEYELLEKHSIHIIRQTLSELSISAHLSPTRSLLISPSPQFPTNPSTTTEISTVYFRAAYTPTDFPTPQHFSTRALLERSRATKCPSIQLQLAGGKMVQMMLTKEGVLERFLTTGGETWEAGRGFTFGEVEVREVRESWVGMWGLGDSPPADSDIQSGISRAAANHANLVLKPQREGGGNNVYKSSIPPFLDKLPGREREAWIAMELIEPPAGVCGWLVRAGGGGGSGGGGVVKSDIVSELGIFGWSLFGPGRDVNKNGNERVMKTGDGGWLVRTKGRESDEGGVAVGFSVLDSVVLVD